MKTLYIPVLLVVIGLVVAALYFLANPYSLSTEETVETEGNEFKLKAVLTKEGVAV